jgi:hypothetical protein
MLNITSVSPFVPDLTGDYHDARSPFEDADRPGNRLDSNCRRTSNDTIR